MILITSIKAAPLRSAAARFRAGLWPWRPARRGPGQADAARHLIIPAHSARIRAIASLPATSRLGHSWTGSGASPATDDVALEDRAVKQLRCRYAMAQNATLDSPALPGVSGSGR